MSTHVDSYYISGESLGNALEDPRILHVSKSSGNSHFVIARISRGNDARNFATTYGVTFRPFRAKDSSLPREDYSSNLFIRPMNEGGEEMVNEAIVTLSNLSAMNYIPEVRYVKTKSGCYIVAFQVGTTLEEKVFVKEFLRRQFPRESLGVYWARKSTGRRNQNQQSAQDQQPQQPTEPQDKH